MPAKIGVDDPTAPPRPAAGQPGLAGVRLGPASPELIGAASPHRPVHHAGVVGGGAQGTRLPEARGLRPTPRRHRLGVPAGGVHPHLPRDEGTARRRATDGGRDPAAAPARHRAAGEGAPARSQHAAPGPVRPVALAHARPSPPSPRREPPPPSPGPPASPPPAPPPPAAPAPAPPAAPTPPTTPPPRRPHRPGDRPRLRRLRAGLGHHLVRHPGVHGPGRVSAVRGRRHPLRDRRRRAGRAGRRSAWPAAARPIGGSSPGSGSRA